MVALLRRLAVMVDRVVAVAANGVIPLQLYPAEPAILRLFLRRKAITVGAGLEQETHQKIIKVVAAVELVP